MSISSGFSISLGEKIIIFIFFLMVSILMLSANPFKGETVAPMGLLQNYSGWANDGIEITPIHPERSDIIDVKLPIWIEAKKALKSGDFGLWNHVSAGGSPGTLIFTNSIITPAFIAFYLFESNAEGFYYSNLVNLMIALVGMFCFLRMFCGPFASFFGSVVFVFSGFNSAWFFWPHVNTGIWLPWVFLFVYRFLKTRNKINLPLLTFSMVFLNLGGFPIVAVMTYMATAIMVLVFFSKKGLFHIENWNRIGWLAVYSSLATLISLIFIFPLAEMLDWIGGIGYRSGGTVLKLSDFMLFLDKNLYQIPRVEKTLYVGILPVVLLLTPIFLILFNKKIDFLLKLGLWVLFVSLTISFSLIHPEIIKKIPTLNSNPWSRFVFLVGFAMALIAASVLNLIEKRLSGYSKYLILTLLIFIQIFDQKLLFNQFNGAVPSKSFYPSTPTIKQIQDSLGDLQYAVADSGFFISGTLGAYGINQWFSHSFHTNEKKKILNSIVHGGFKTPTAAMFDCSQINFESKYINFLNIKYILCSSQNKNKLELWNNNSIKTPAPPMPKNQLTQDFQVKNKLKVRGINILMATYGKEQSSTDVELELYKNNVLIRKSIVKKNQIKDNRWVFFNLHELDLPEGKYSIKIKLLDGENSLPLTIWTNDKDYENGMLVNGMKTNKSWRMTLSQVNVDEKYKTSFYEEGITVYENPYIVGGAYLMNNLNERELTSYKNISTKKTSNTEIQVKYDTNGNDKWIIIPMRSYPGWSAYVDDKKVEVEKFLGFLPAIKVNGKGNLKYIFEPLHYKINGLISFTAFLITLFSILKYRRTK